jgi:hypothetical protein
MLDKYKIFREIVETLDKGGMTKDPLVLKACQQFSDFGYIKTLERLLNKHPQILEIARRNIQEQMDYPFWPPPYKNREIDKLKGEYDLGIINNYGDRVYLDPIDFTRGLMVFGESGSGKSYPLLRLLLQILSTPIQERGFNVIIIQASKQDANFLIKHNKDLLCLDWEDIRRSPLQVEGWDTRKAKINSFCSVYAANNWLMAYGQPLFKNTVNICMDRFGNDTNFHKLSNSINVSAKFLGIQGPEHRNLRDNLRSTLFSFRETEKVLNSKNGFTVEDFFTKNDLILNMQPWQQPSDYVIATFLSDLLKDIQRFYRTNPLYGKMRTLIVIDECRRVFPGTQTHNKTGHEPNAPMIEFFTTKRSDGIGFAGGTQEFSSAPDWLVINSAYILSMAISGKGRKDAKDILNLTKEQASFIDHFPKFGTGIMRYRGFEKRFLVVIPSDLDDTPIHPNEVKELMKDKIKALHEPIEKAIEEEILELKEKQQIEEEKKKQKQIQKMTLKMATKQAITYLDSITIIDSIVKNNFIHKTQIRESSLKKSSGRMNDAVNYLLSENFITIQKGMNVACNSPNTEYLLLTDKAKENYNLNTKIYDPSHFKHTLYENRVEKFLIFKGCETKIEYTEKDKQGFIDILAIEPDTKKRIAYEITLSFSNLVDNVLKCLNVFNIDDVHIVTENQTEEKKAEARIANSKRIPYQDLKKITFNTLKDFRILENQKPKK